jgi:hypothetical protein
MTKIKSLAPDGSYSCGNQSINGYNQTRQELKEQFLRDARALLKQTCEFLTQSGWTDCEIRVNSAGVAVSGDVYAEFWKPADPLNIVYCTISTSAIPFSGRKDGVIITACQYASRAMAASARPANWAGISYEQWKYRRRTVYDKLLQIRRHFAFFYQTLIIAI